MLQRVIFKIFFSQFFFNFLILASYQIEGAWDKNGKIPNIWDKVTHENPNSIDDRSNGDEAANSYEFYKRDVEILKETGVREFNYNLSP